MADYLESNVFLIRNLIDDNKTYKRVSEILRQNFTSNKRLFGKKRSIVLR